MTSHGCDHYVRVHLDDRAFVVEFNADGEVVRIKERKQKDKPQVGIYLVSYWVARNHPLGNSPDTMPRRIIAAAREKHVAL